jgi:hypothetical protein
VELTFLVKTIRLDLDLIPIAPYTHIENFANLSVGANLSSGQSPRRRQTQRLSGPIQNVDSSQKRGFRSATSFTRNHERTASVLEFDLESEPDIGAEVDNVILADY